MLFIRVLYVLFEVVYVFCGFVEARASCASLSRGFAIRGAIGYPGEGLCMLS